MPPSRPWKIKAFEQENPVKLNDKVTTIKWEMKYVKGCSRFILIQYYKHRRGDPKIIGLYK